MCRCGTFRVTNKPAAPPVPLTGVAFDISVLGFCAEVTVRQRFENTETEPIEATFEFVLEENAAVSNFTATIDGRTVEAKLKEKEAAKDTYDDAIASGGGAYLVEQSTERKNAFTVSVGNLPPHKEAMVSLTYVTEATVEEDFVVFKLPGGEPLKLGTPGIKSEFATQFPKPYGIRAAFEMANNIKSIASATHPITFEFGDAMNKASVSYAQDAPPATPEDFVLRVMLADPHEPMARVQQEAGGGAVAMLSFYPKLEAEQAPTELLFLVDRSGSMAGSSMRQVKETLQFFLRSLSEGVLFNIIGFGSSHQLLFGQSTPYADDSLEKASAHVAALEANLGGTNVLRPLMEIFQRRPTAGCARQIFLLTDGQVSNSQECIDAVRANANSTRVFTFGIGNDVDKNLVYGIAKAGEGRCELIAASDGSMNQKVMRQLSYALKPALTEVKLEWAGLQVRQAPYVLPPLFSGSRLLVYAFLEAGAAPGSATLSGKFGPEAFASRIAVDPTQVAPGSQAVRLATRSLLRDLEEGRSCLGKIDAARQRAEMLALSLRNGVLCKHTAFVAVEHRGAATEGTMVQRAVRLAPLPDNKPLPQPLPQPMSAPGAVPLMFAMRGAPPMKPMAMAMPSSSSSSYSAAPPAAAPRRSAMAPQMAMEQQQQQQAEKLDMLVDRSCDLSAPSEAFKKSASKPKGRGGFGFGFGGSSRAKSSEAPPPPPAAARARGAEKKKEEQKWRKEICRDEATRAPAEEMEEADEDASGSAGSDDLFAASEGLAAPRSCSPPRAPPLMAAGLAMPSAPGAPPPMIASSALPPPPPPAAAAAPAAPATGAIAGIVQKQKANGSWQPESLALIGIAAAAAAQGMPAAAAGRPGAEVVWATVLVAAFLQTKYAAARVEWELIVKKALKWAAKAGADIAPGLDWEAKATEFVSRL